MVTTTVSFRKRNSRKVENYNKRIENSRKVENYNKRIENSRKVEKIIWRKDIWG